jgi:hypothetical protein
LGNFQTKPNSVKQEADKLDELKRASVRSICILRRVPELERSPKMKITFDFIMSDPELRDMIKEVDRQ